MSDNWPQRFAAMLEAHRRRREVKRTIRAALATARQAGLEARQQRKIEATKEEA
jgi:hypothetical protein